MAVPIRPLVKPARQVVEELRRDLALSDQELSAILAVPTTVLCSERIEERLEQQLAQPRLDQLVELRERLHETFAPEGAASWLRGDSRYLGGEKPIEALMIGRFDRVNAALGALDWGIFV